MQRLVAAPHIEDEVPLFLFARVKDIRVAGVRQPDEFPQRETPFELCRGLQISDEAWIETLERSRNADLGHHGFPCVDDEVRPPSPQFAQRRQMDRASWTRA